MRIEMKVKRLLKGLIKQHERAKVYDILADQYQPSSVLLGIFCEFVSFPNKPVEDWYWLIEISYTQVFSRCSISPCNSPFNFHFYKFKYNIEPRNHSIYFSLFTFTLQIIWFEMILLFI